MTFPSAIARAGRRSRRITIALSRGIRSSRAMRIRSRISGTLGTGNHFIEVCLDESDRVWLMLHSGSRGVGNRIGSYFIELAKKDMRRYHRSICPTRISPTCRRRHRSTSTTTSRRWDGRRTTRAMNRELMMAAIVEAVRATPGLPRVRGHRRSRQLPPQLRGARRRTSAKKVLVTRKGAVRARRGRSRHHPRQHGRAVATSCAGKGNPDSFMSCSHGAGRSMSRTRGQARASPSRITRRRPRASNAARTPTSSTRPRGLQADRRGDGGAERPRRGRAHAASGRMREGMMRW